MPESNSIPVRGFAKSVLLGGGVSGILSIFPGVNLLNLFFMFWIVLGSGLTMYLLSRENRSLRRGDALLAGALSGLTGGSIFGALGLVSIVSLTQEKLDMMIESARSLAPFLVDDPSVAMTSSRFKAVMAVAIGLFMLFAILAGALAGLAARPLFRPAGSPRP